MEMTEMGQNKQNVPRFDNSRVLAGRPVIEDKSVHRVVHKLRRLFGKVIMGEKPVTRSSIIETDHDRQRVSENLDENIPGLNDYGSFDDISEFRVCQRISKQLEELLSAGGKKDLNCDLLVPADLSCKIARDVLRMSQNEPCGIRGCVLYINIEEKSVCRKLGKIECDPSTVATFELYLTLKEDTRPWVMAKSLFVSFKGCLIDGRSNSIKVLCPGFQLAKTKLYRPN